MKILKNKNGSALLLSLLITSALLSSILYINTISLRQSLQVTNIDNSLHSYYGAEAGNEEALYKLKSGNYVDIADLNSTFNIGNSRVVRTVSDNLLTITTGLEKDKFFQFDVFNPNDIGEGSNLEYLSFFWEDDCSGKSWIELTSNEWSGDNISNVGWGSDANQDHIKKTLLNLDPPDEGEEPLNRITSIDGSVFDRYKAYQFRIKALYCNIKNLNISAFDRGTPIPFNNIYNIISVAEYPRNSSRANKQALSINFKKVAPLSGLFDYVIFSEQSLIKDLEANTIGSYSNEFYIGEADYLNIPVDSYYSHQISTVNGTPPYKCEITGSMPDGLEKDNCSFFGTIKSQGTPVGETYQIDIEAKDSTEPKQTATKHMYLIVK